METKHKTGSKFKVQSSKLRNIGHSFEKMFNVLSSKFKTWNISPRTLNIEPRTVFSLLLLLAFSVAGCGRSDIAKSSQVLARVDNKEITISYFERQRDNLPESLQKLSTEGKGKKALLEGLINREILYREAERKKIDKDADIKRKLDDTKKELVINTFIQREVAGKVKVDDKEVQDYYNSHPAEFKNREEIRISQIVVPEEKDANDILNKLRERKDFGELAIKYSIDKASAQRKGDVGFFVYKQLPPEIRDSVFRMKVGEISGAHKMSGGYEIYKITDRRVVSYSFEQVKDALKAQLINQKFQESLKALLADLKKDIKIQINESLLK